MVNLEYVQRLYETSRHLRKSQILHRLKFITKRKVIFPLKLKTMNDYQKRAKKYPYSKTPFYTSSLSMESTVDNLLENHELIEKLKRRTIPLRNRTFEFLNRKHTFHDSITWNDHAHAHLWRYNLHYFNYVLDLGCLWRLLPEEKWCYETFKEIVIDWIEKNSDIGVGDGWHPYTISLRIVNWTYSYDLFFPLIEEDHEFKERFLESYYIQALFLLDNIEYDGLGNHLIENGRALTMAGLFFNHDYARRFYDTGLSILSHELEEQVLSDGGHYERSPMYHLIVLRDYLEIIRLLKINDRVSDIQDRMLNKVKDMLTFLHEILHPDGQIPLLNDSAFNIASTPGTLRILGANLGLCNVLPEDELDSVFDHFLLGVDRENNFTSHTASNSTIFNAWESGYYVYRKSHLYLIVDAGQPSPDFLPAHAHADFGSYELSLWGKRWVVDSGVYQYQGPLRNKFRGTKAHNALMIDKENQSDVWGSFRMARRAKPRAVKVNYSGLIWSMEAVHDGYAHKSIFPKRKIYILDNSILIIADEVASKGTHVIESFHHFHPDIKINQIDWGFQGCHENQSISIIPFCSTDFDTSIKKTWYSPEFGIKLANSTVKMKCNLVNSFVTLGCLMLLNKGAVIDKKIRKNYIKIKTKRSTYELSFDSGLELNIPKSGDTL